MFRLKINKWLMAGLVAIFFASACEEEKTYPEEVIVTGEDINLMYTKFDSYPKAEVITASAPSFELEGQYGFIIESVSSDDLESVNNKLFSIDKATGAISVDNTKGNIDVATYKVFVSILNRNGKIKFETPALIEILAPPIELTFTPATKTVGFFDQVSVCTPDLVHTGGGEFASVAYEITNAQTGISIDAETGEVIKGIGLPSGTHSFSVKVTTDLGTKTFADIFSVEVGPEPTMQFTAQAGGQLSKVTLSPWSAYTSQTPVLNGMDADGGYEFLNLPAALNGKATIDATTGVITIAADQNLLAGTYSIGLSATNSSDIKVDFADLFSITVEERWNTLSSEDFADITTTESVAHGESFASYPSYSTYAIDGTASLWALNYAAAKDQNGIRVFNSNSPVAINASLVKTVDLQATDQKIRVTFSEIYGYNNTFMPTTYNRAFYYGSDLTNISSGTFDTNDWNVIFDYDNANWSTDTGWGSSTKNTMPAQIIAVGGMSAVYLNWRVFNIADGVDSKGQYFIDDVLVEVSSTFAAEETVVQ